MAKKKEVCTESQPCLPFFICVEDYRVRSADITSSGLSNSKKIENVSVAETEPEEIIGKNRWWLNY